jgi:excisionase family DNA binding protein
LKTAEVAELLGFKPETIRRWARAGRLPYVKAPGGDLRFSEAAIERWKQVRTIPGKGRV